jgi:hypothetical protein
VFDHPDGALLVQSIFRRSNRAEECEHLFTKGEVPALLLEKIGQLLRPGSQVQSAWETRMAKNGKSELWIELAELAAQEEDPKKLLVLVAAINRLLDKKDNFAKDRWAKINPEAAWLLEQKQALLKDGSTKPDLFSMADKTVTCYFCQKPVDLASASTDERGRCVHGNCYERAMMEVRAAKDKSGRSTDV